MQECCSAARSVGLAMVRIGTPALHLRFRGCAPPSDHGMVSETERGSHVAGKINGQNLDFVRSGDYFLTGVIVNYTFII